MADLSTGTLISGEDILNTNYKSVLDFWFSELSAKDWFVTSDDIDKTIRQRFSLLHASASRGECWVWRKTPLGRLAEIIVLDQFSRNIFRDDKRAFAQDAMALVLAQEAIAQGEDLELSPVQRSFLYMPYMHSESLKVHEEAEKLFLAPGLENNLAFERKHKVIIERFGRYPHRNSVLGRESTEEESEFLKQPGSSF